MNNTEENNCNKVCFCCGRPEKDVPYLLEGNHGYICSDCINLGYKFISDNKHKDINDHIMEGIPKPREIKAFLDQYVIGQDRVKERVAVAVYNHYKRISAPIINDVEIEKSNICIVGPTGTGKCIAGNTKVKIRNKKTGEIYYDTINNLKNKLITSQSNN